MSLKNRDDLDRLTPCLYPNRWAVAARMVTFSIKLWQNVTMRGPRLGSVLGTTLQLTWFLRLNIIVGCFLLLIDVAGLLAMHSGYMPVFFAFGFGILWIACYFMKRRGEQVLDPNGP